MSWVPKECYKHFVESVSKKSDWGSHKDGALIGIFERNENLFFLHFCGCQWLGGEGAESFGWALKSAGIGMGVGGREGEWVRAKGGLDVFDCLFEILLGSRAHVSSWLGCEDGFV